MLNACRSKNNHPLREVFFRALKKSVGLDIAVIVGVGKKRKLRKGNGPRLIVGTPCHLGHTLAHAADARLNLVHKAASGVHLIIFPKVTLGTTQRLMIIYVIDVHAGVVQLVYRS